jgi:hypothetical protein
MACIASIFMTGASAAIACEYKSGVTKFKDYAICRYSEDSIVVVDLPKDFVWDQCVYYVEAFRPPKLLAVTRDKDGREVASINDRTQIGNPCYLTKQHCDAAYKIAQQ